MNRHLAARPGYTPQEAEIERLGAAIPSEGILGVSNADVDELLAEVGRRPAVADDELFYTNFGIDQAGDIVTRLRAEIERLREQVAEMLTLMEDIVIGERIRERDANDNGHRTPLGEVAADFGIDLTLDEMQEARRG